MALDARTKLRLKQIKIKNWVLLPQAIQELNIFESITREGITGNILISDWQALRELGFIFAGDDITMEFASEDHISLVLKMKIYATYDNQSIMENTFNSTNFMFCSSWLMDGYMRQISKPYKDKFIHEIVEDLLKECGATIGYIEPTKQKMECFVTPLWSAVRSIRYLLGFARNNEKKGGYIIWTDLATDEVNCTTLDYLLKGSLGSTSRFTQMPANPQYEGAIKMATLEQTFDAIQFVHCGLPKIRNYTFWFDKKKVESTEDDIKKMEYTHLSKKLPVDKKYIEDKKYCTNHYTSLYPKKANAVTDIDELKDYYESEQYTRYCYLMTDLFKINIETIGNSERRAGMLVDLDLQGQNEPESRGGNKQINGKYLIRDIRHVISSSDGEYSQFVTLAGDGFYEFNDDRPITW